ncbi:MarR family winged helix-turn-helix transcriptional regulator [Thermophilibacter provencensis]|uniref:MarR family transcriptional regulator n=1 Tax=Thermophilibacter provencensis TaxID=1852386 RepID=A0ABT7V4X8_9ACTN|nr:MarR family transcriptional regulator [Thermophilibacter provencensis]MDM8271664.1 MarR family transcriptional regulator [Thermophilibacter provencensis]
MTEKRFEDFVGIISALNKEIQRIKTAEAKRLGFRGSDVMCLYYLVKHPEGLTASELARVVDVSRAAMSRTIAHLAEDGFVEVGDAEEGDASKYRAPVRLTEKGFEAARPLDDIIHRVLDEAGGELAMRERLQMYDSLNHILERLRTFARD